MWALSSTISAIIGSGGMGANALVFPNRDAAFADVHDKLNVLSQIHLTVLLRIAIFIYSRTRGFLQKSPDAAASGLFFLIRFTSKGLEAQTTGGLNGQMAVAG
jgi:hypothetical protein